MGTGDAKGYFIDFILDASAKDRSKNWDLGYDFVHYLGKEITPTVDELHGWFSDRGYLVTKNDCQRIITDRAGIVNIKEVSNSRTY
jgi:hypothetical protein